MECYTYCNLSGWSAVPDIFRDMDVCDETKLGFDAVPMIKYGNDFGFHVTVLHAPDPEAAPHKCRYLVWVGTEKNSIPVLCRDLPAMLSLLREVRPLVQTDTVISGSGWRVGDIPVAFFAVDEAGEALPFGFETDGSTALLSGRVAYGRR